MVLQRYALRFTISDATLDSLKLPRSTSDLKQDTNHVVKEHKTVQLKAAKSEEVEKKPTVEQLTSASPSPVTQSENVPPQSLQLQPTTTESPNRHQKPEETRPQTICTPTEIAQMQPNTIQPAHTLPSPSSPTPRPVPLLAAKPYCQPRNSQPGHKPVKVSINISLKCRLFTDIWSGCLCICSGLCFLSLNYIIWWMFTL